MHHMLYHTHRKKTWVKY